MKDQTRLHVRISSEAKDLVLSAAERDGLTQQEIVESIIWDTLGPDPRAAMAHATVQQIDRNLRILAELLALNTHALLARDPRKPDKESLRLADQLMDKCMTVARERSVHDSVLDAISEPDYR